VVDITVTCLEQPTDVYATFRIMVNAPNGYLFYTQPPGETLLQNWCLNDTQNELPLGVPSGCIYATYDLDDCAVPSVENSCEATKCFTCP
jgi:hypothetical protein